MKINLRALFVLAVILACGAMLLDLAHNAPGPTAIRVMDYAKEKQIPYTSYPQSLIELLERNPATEEFVLNYPFREEKKVDIGEYDAKEGVPLFLQWDARWGYMTYGSDFVGVSGSGPMCLAMAGYYVSGGEKKFSPDRVVEFVLKNGYVTKGAGQGGNLISKGGTALGLKIKELPQVERKVADYLKNGDPVIASMGPGSFDNYVVMTGYQNGMVTINDPDSRENSEKQWVFEEISGQIRNLWVIQMGSE